ncbi:hypothetical protein GEMRC1_005034 [Eukaryota sp. GEM-RC1]
MIFAIRPPKPKRKICRNSAKNLMHSTNPLCLSSSSSVSTLGSFGGDHFFQSSPLVLHPSVLVDTLSVIVLSYCYPRGTSHSSPIFLSLLLRKWPCFTATYKGRPFHLQLRDELSLLTSSLLDQMTVNINLRFGPYIAQFPLTIDIDFAPSSTFTQLSSLIQSLSVDALNGSQMVDVGDSVDSSFELHIGTQIPEHWLSKSDTKISNKPLTSRPPSIF